MATRRDGRTNTQMRGKELRTSQLSQFDGSAWYSQGQATVLACVNGPLAARPEAEDYRKCNIEVVVMRSSNFPTAGGASRSIVDRARASREARDVDLSVTVASMLQNVILVESFPRCTIQVTIDVLNDDGGLLAVAVNAVMCAFLDAGIPCRTTFAAVSILLTLNADSKLTVLLDPTAEEELNVGNYDVSATLVYNLPSCGGGLLASRIVRTCGRDTAPRALGVGDIVALENVGEKAAKVLFEFFRNCSAPPKEEESEVAV